MQIMPLKGKYNKNLTDFLLFLGEIAKRPRVVGAFCSKSLARSMAKQIPPTARYVLELGGGTGSMTRPILNQRIAPENLTVIEQSEPLAKNLSKRFPGIRVIHGDAQHLEILLGREAEHIDVILSGLPLRSMPKAVVTAIGGQLETLLPRGALFIQFIYALYTKSAGLSPHLKWRHHQLVMKNFPPARVNVYQYLPPEACLHAE